MGLFAQHSSRNAIPRDYWLRWSHLINVYIVKTSVLNRDVVVRERTGSSKV